MVFCFLDEDLLRFVAYLEDQNVLVQIDDGQSDTGDEHRVSDGGIDIFSGFSYRSSKDGVGSTLV